ncbi:regucalcin-like [Marmota monax]|uniref:regucalcin-like n=1 Tax=Marmota monax TaxID=9995 RepID=UPI0026EF8CB8|nr:regucalcin-like [Marmota monax]
MASPRIQAVIRERHRMRECPVWEEVTAQLVYVDINARTVCWWNPLSGEVQTVGLRTRLCTLEMPVSRMTSCSFRGADYSNLYVTSAVDSLSPEQLLREPQAGHVFKVMGLWRPAPSLAEGPHSPAQLKPGLGPWGRARLRSGRALPA